MSCAMLGGLRRRLASAVIMRPARQHLLRSPWLLPANPAAVRHHGSVVDPNAELITFHFKLRDGSRKTVSVPSGTNVLEAAHANQVDLEGACEASLACSTCHVILPQEVFKAQGEATEKEEDLLDMCPCLEPTSRLGCQVIVDEKLRDKEVTLPPMTLNFYVDGHVPSPH
ncbi:unnamed protein product [Polarella glacialis]|uniref:2Fe-2S ferredoxin n=1 Tax=Polarella glacialis TaxID=89957 RepID=A0A813H0E7_POLGL|nr:unnamed protein product [Polarella glacialis]CAE8712971.1 unnamed protein product [Polarella glacialis]|mmetsp:Transcript_23110/g.37165  ORF Transcript_23110/g.37165 Transcript_23110/m.37165 type:complete len:170 (-) Transcript_23110:124-633(-)